MVTTGVVAGTGVIVVIEVVAGVGVDVGSIGTEGVGVRTGEIWRSSRKPFGIVAVGNVVGVVIVVIVGTKVGVGPPEADSVARVGTRVGKVIILLE